MKFRTLEQGVTNKEWQQEKHQYMTEIVCFMLNNKMLLVREQLLKAR